MYTSIMIWILQKLEGLSYGITTKRSCWHITIRGRQPILEKFTKLPVQLSNILMVLMWRWNKPLFPPGTKFTKLQKRFCLSKSSLLLTFIKRSYVILFYKCFFFYLWLHYALPVTKSMSSWKTRHLTNCCKSPFYYKILGTFEANLEKCRFSYTGG